MQNTYPLTPLHFKVFVEDLAWPDQDEVPGWYNPCCLVTKGLRSCNIALEKGRDIQSLASACFEVASYGMTRNGIGLDGGTDEVLAYLTEHLFVSVLKDFGSSLTWEDSDLVIEGQDYRDCDSYKLLAFDHKVSIRVMDEPHPRHAGIYHNSESTIELYRSHLDMGVIVHESCHAVVALMKKCHITLTSESSKFAGAMLQELVEYLVAWCRHRGYAIEGVPGHTGVKGETGELKLD